MKAYDLVELAGRNLREAVLRNSLTTIGIAVGVASLVAMLSLGVGLQQVFGKRLGRSGLFDTVIVASKQDFRTEDDRRNRPNMQSGEIKSLDDTARQTFEKISGVAEVYPEIRLTAELRFAVDGKAERPHFAAITALPTSANNSEAFEDLQGKFFSGPKAEEAIVLGEFARELLEMPEDTRQSDKQKLSNEDANRLIGKELTLRYAERATNNESAIAPSDSNKAKAADEAGANFDFSVVRREKKLKIVGVVNTEPYGGMRSVSRGRVFIPTGLAESMNFMQPSDLRTLMRASKGKTYMTLIVRANKPTQIPVIQETIKKMGFSTYSMQDASKTLRYVFIFLDMFLAIFGSLALAVASLGIMNTLVMAILERRREIGIMKALGASDIDVKKLFFVEAGAMGVLGGVLGTSLGWTIGRVINFGTNIWLQRQDIPTENFWYVPWWLVVGAMVFSVFVSLGSGLYPASRAAKLDPVQALRHD
ncbi:MAG: cell division protein FtsX [Candidatus Angelobacter sp.]|nr:cell division protein FtsX [Candidatus Angelobacter sp.]